MPTGNERDEHGRLTEASYWNDVWANDRPHDHEHDHDDAVPTGGRLRKILGEKNVDRLKALLASYDDQVLWKSLMGHYLPPLHGAKVVEIGSAPGTFLIRMSHVFGCEPWGIEYTESGCAINRETFRRAGFPESNVIQADFFSGDLLRSHGSSFDVVMSRGFVEHFDDVPSVVRRHVDFVRPGGHLVIAIPRFRGVYGAWMRMFDREDLNRHNLEIMKKDVFTSAFQADGRLEPLYCGYFGGLQLRRFVLKRPGRAAHLYDTLVKRSAMMLDAVNRVALRPPGLESDLFSPYLIYLGRRRS